MLSVIVNLDKSLTLLQYFFHSVFVKAPIQMTLEAVYSGLPFSKKKPQARSPSQLLSRGLYVNKEK